MAVEGKMVSELDMIYIESILKASSSVDVTLRSVRAETTNQQPPSRPPSDELSLPSSQHNQVVEVTAASSVETASRSGNAGTNELPMNVSIYEIIGGKII